MFAEVLSLKSKSFANSAECNEASFVFCFRLLFSKPALSIEVVVYRIGQGVNCVSPLHCL